MNTEFGIDELRFVGIGFNFPDFELEVNEFYRIGEPTIDNFFQLL